MSSPSERFAAARRRAGHPVLTDFRAGYSFELDEFQSRACADLERGYSVLVCAPTGAGKTVVGEFAVHLALAADQKCFYTTPIKALSNQKYNDLVERYGAGSVGLLTGDSAVNGNAPIIVMTTEVLRNMLYAGSGALNGLGYVVMDEVHYLGDRFRGAVWEEVIIHLPAAVRLVSLSATVSNAEEFGEWLQSVRGEMSVIVHEERPVPLWQHMLVGNRVFDLFAGTDPRGGDGPGGARINGELQRYVDERRRFVEPTGRRGSGRHDARHGARGWRAPHRPDVIARLDRDGLLPAITFIFSRAGCDAAARQCVLAGMWLTDEDERAEIDEVIEHSVAQVPAEDLDVLGYWDWREALRRGFAAHHAGLIPPFKQAVEELFVRGLVRAVFATETLALGINMPARTVVLERLTKYNGEAHAAITAGEYTQLTGRAGRRGIDVEGHAVVVWSPEVDPPSVGGLASTRTYPLRSSFRPSYNMAVNLVAQMGRADARQLLESSFAQFQSDRAVAGLVRQIRRSEETMAGYAKSMTCERGGFTEYADLRRRLSDREAATARESGRNRRAEVSNSLEGLRRGDVIRVPRGRRSGLAVVLDPGAQPHDDPRPLVVTEARWSGRLSSTDFPGAVVVLGSVRLGKSVNHRSPQERRDIVSRLRALDLAPEPDRPNGRRAAANAHEDPELLRLRRSLRAHPCHECPEREEHARWAERYARLERENVKVRARIDGRTGSLGRAFDRICALLDERGYLDGDTVLPAGRRLARIWSEADLVIAECLRANAWAGLTPAELAAVVSTMVYEPRREELAVPAAPTEAVRAALERAEAIWSALAGDEDGAGLPRSREPQRGFVVAAYRWAQGRGLADVLDAAGQRGEQMPAGDFIRWCKQLLDLLDQLGGAPAGSRVGATADAARGADLARTARSAAAAVRRGVVAQSMGP